MDYWDIKKFLKSLSTYYLQLLVNDISEILKGRECKDCGKYEHKYHKPSKCPAVRLFECHDCFQACLEEVEAVSKSNEANQ